jgi:Nucleoside-diphosphate-sugar epimerases
MSKIIVTGGSGFIGHNLTQVLCEKHEVINIDVNKPLIHIEGASWVCCDIRDTKALRKIFERSTPDYVVHLAARTDLLGHSLDDYDVNTTGTQSVIDAIRSSSSIKKAVFASSMLVCKVGYIPSSYQDYCPSTVYGESKVMMEGIVRSSSLSTHWTLFRPTSIWGPWFNAPYRDFFDMVRRGKFVGVSGCATKTYGYVGNTVYQIAKLLFDASANSHQKTFYIGDNPPININSWASEISGKLGKKDPFVLPKFVILLAGKFGDLLGCLGIKFPLNSFRYKNLTTDNIIPLDDLYSVVGPPPFTRSEGIDRTLDWMSNH